MTQIDQTALLPCPFCGGEATVEEVSAQAYDGKRFSVGCSDETGDCYGYQSFTTFDRRTDATAAWNSRSAIPPAIPSLDRNELFKRVCKQGMPINALIGAARSVSGMDRSHGVRKEWVDSVLESAEKAREAWDAIVGILDQVAPAIPSDAVMASRVRELESLLEGVLALVPEPPLVSMGFDSPPEHATEADHQLGYLLLQIRRTLNPNHKEDNHE